MTEEVLRLYDAKEPAIVVFDYIGCEVAVMLASNHDYYGPIVSLETFGIPQFDKETGAPSAFGVPKLTTEQREAVIRTVREGYDAVAKFDGLSHSGSGCYYPAHPDEWSGTEYQGYANEVLSVLAEREKGVDGE